MGVLWTVHNSKGPREIARNVDVPGAIQCEPIDAIAARSADFSYPLKLTVLVVLGNETLSSIRCPWTEPSRRRDQNRQLPLKNPPTYTSPVGSCT